MTASIRPIQPGRGTHPVPFFFDADADALRSPEASRAAELPGSTLPNRHLEYAMTWYGLALTLIGVFAAFARSRLRTPG